MTSDGDHDPTMGSPARGVTRDLHACRSLPQPAGADRLTVGGSAHCPTTGQYLSPLGPTLVDAAARLAEIRHREAQLAAMVASGYFVQRAPVVDWRDRLLDDVLRGQESP